MSGTHLELSQDIARLLSGVRRGSPIDPKMQGAELAFRYAGLGVSPELMEKAILRAADMVNIRLGPEGPPEQPAEAPVLAETAHFAAAPEPLEVPETPSESGMEDADPLAEAGEAQFDPGAVAPLDWPDSAASDSAPMLRRAADAKELVFQHPPRVVVHKRRSVSLRRSASALRRMLFEP